MDDSAEAIARDVAAIGRIDAVPSLLRVVCQSTGMGFAAVARVTEGSWTACAVQDDIAFGLVPGSQLDVHTTLCKESRELRQPVVVDSASTDDAWRHHPTMRTYNIERYISVPIVLRDGSCFGNLCAIDRRPAKVSDPRTVSMLSLFAELIAVQLENERRLDQQRNAILDERATSELREEFIAVLGHDLRSPLMAVMAGAQSLHTHSLDVVKVRCLADRIGNSARRMSGLIDDVLDFARGRLGGGFTVQLGEIADFDQALRDIVAEVQLCFPGRLIRTEIDVKGMVRCDRARVQQLVSNLLVNALTHGAPDKPVRFSAAADHETIALTVTNEGEPIAPADLPKVFRPFWRDSTAGQRDGLGLGLFISAQIVKSHGGTLEVLSSAEDGTTFAARLPYSGVASRSSSPPSAT